MTAPKASRWPGLLEHRPFLLAVAVLAAAAALNGPVADWSDIKQGKQPLPLRAALDTLDERSLSPYRVLHRQVLDPVVVEALGTEQYLSWTLEDTSVAANDPLRFASLLVTYDTGGHNLVPHTPDVCYLGAGYAPAQRHDDRVVTVPSLPPGKESVPLRVCTFVKTAVFGGEQVTVVYTFGCNGRFVSTRTDVRWLLNNLRNTHAYFSKVEVSFPKATREQCRTGAVKLLDRVLPILVRDHWPDFEAAERAVAGPAGKG